MKNVIAAYKKHGVLYVSQFEWGGFIWRPLTLAEAELYSALFRIVPQAKAELEDEIFHECVIEHPLHGESFENWKAGIVTTVAQQILFFSTVKNPNEFLRRLIEARDSFQNEALKELCGRIIAVFPGYTLEQLKEQPLDQLFEKLALLELVTQEKIELQPIEEQRPRIPNFIDFAEENKKLSQADLETPPGDWNLDRRRGNS